MRESRCTYTLFDVSQVYQASIPRIFKKFDHLLDGIIDKIYVYCPTGDDEDGGDFVASINCQREYRQVTICIATKFWTLTERDQELAICHEFAHIITDPLYETVTEIATMLTNEGEGMTEYVSEQIRKANEKVVEDLSRIFIDFTMEVGDESGT